MVFALRGTILWRVLGCVIVASLIGVAAVRAELDVPLLPYELVGVALFLLLVLRTHLSWGRYDEARAVLGQLVSASRDLARQLGAYVPDQGDAVAVRRDVGRYIGAFYRLLVQNLRGEDELAELQSRLGQPEIAALRKLSNGRELSIASRITTRLARLRNRDVISDDSLSTMDASVSAMVRAATECERIARTPFPFPYAQHLGVLLMLFCFTLPLALVGSLDEYTPIAAGLVAFALFGIDQIGVEIADPFGRKPNDLPIDALGDVIDEAVRRALSLPDVVRPPPGEEVDEFFVAMG